MSDFPPVGEERQVIRFLDAIDSEAEGAKRDVAKGWEDNIRQVRGDQWRLKRAPYFLMNMIKNQLRRKVGAMTETGPQIRVHPLKGDLIKSSNVLYNTGRAIFDRDHTKDVVYRACQFGMTVGCGFFGVIYDPMDNENHITFVDPRQVFIDPGVTSGVDLDRGQYIRIDTILPIADIRQRFAGRGLLVKPEEKYSTFPSSPPTSRTSILGSVLSNMPRPYRPGLATKAGPIPRAMLKEYWVKDPQINTDGTLLFPGGRHIIRAANVVLVDEANPYWDGGWPLVSFEWDVDFESPWGLDEIQDLRRIQEAINRMGDAWVRNVLLGSNFRIVADIDALDPDQWDKLDNEAGLIIRKKPQRQFEYQAPVELGQTIPNTITAFMQMADMLTGNTEMHPTQSQAESSSILEGLQSVRQTLLRSVSRRLESTLERVGQKLISRIFQYYTSDRILLQLGPTKEWTSYTFERLKLMEKDNSEPRDPEKISEMFRDYKFLITPGSSLALSRIQRTMTLLQLRAATGFVPSVRRIVAESDIGDVDSLMQEGLEELKWIPQPPPQKGKGGSGKK